MVGHIFIDAVPNKSPNVVLIGEVQSRSCDW